MLLLSSHLNTYRCTVKCCVLMLYMYSIHVVQVCTCTHRYFVESSLLLTVSAVS